MSLNLRGAGRCSVGGWLIGMDTVERAEAAEKFGDGGVLNWDNEFRSEIGEGNENKGAFMQTWMRQRQVGRRHDTVIVE